MAVNASGAPGGASSSGAFAPATPTLQLKNISKAFGTVQALQGVDFEVHAGEVVGLVGDNGAGKSTLIKIMAGVYVPDTGEIDVDGRRVTISSPQDATRVGIETVYQDLALCDNLDVVANLFLGREEYTTLIPFVVRPMNEVDMERRAREVLTQLEVKIPSLRTPVAALSGGQRQSIAVAKTILRNAKVVLLDEPTAALGVAQTRQVLNLIQRLRSQGLAVVVISHNLADVFEVVDRVIVMRLGQRVATFDVRNTTSEQVVSAITGAEFGMGMGGQHNGGNGGNGGAVAREQSPAQATATPPAE
ncbi:MAG TPA: ATP-binding cassette domain-containing protein [Ktedonobacterales bacterium]|nr:ATP-binding cassette domain-containing protein [Ktedonobacterales bacterium]